MSGNKGAAAIRLEYHDTNFCFLTAHLAAGHSNVEERNADYRTITSGLHFLKGKTISSHEYVVRHFLCLLPLMLACRNVIWLADTNYRIDLENETVRAFAQAEDFDSLLSADQVSEHGLLSCSAYDDLVFQLKQMMDARIAFVGYDEGPLLFKPTYRYDVGTDNYDTSEKYRIPAWTGSCSDVVL